MASKTSPHEAHIRTHTQTTQQQQQQQQQIQKKHE
jgi:hypothetical protein